MTLRDKFAAIHEVFEKKEDRYVEFIIVPVELYMQMRQDLKPDLDEIGHRAILQEFNMFATLWTARVYVGKDASKVIYGSETLNIAYTIDADLNLESLKQSQLLTVLSRAKF